MNKNTTGSAVFFVMLAMILFAALGFALTKSSRNINVDYSAHTAVNDLNDFLSYPETLEMVVQDMLLRGVKHDDIDFVAPGEAGFTTSPHGAKVFHPQGGGVEYRTQPEPTYADYVYNTAASMIGFGKAFGAGGADIMFGAEVSLERCREINDRLYGSNAITAATSANLTTFLGGGAIDHGGSNVLKHRCVTDLNGGQPATQIWQKDLYYAGFLTQLPRLKTLPDTPFQNVYANPGDEIYVYIHLLAWR